MRFDPAQGRCRSEADLGAGVFGAEHVLPPHHDPGAAAKRPRGAASPHRPAKTPAAGADRPATASGGGLRAAFLAVCRPLASDLACRRTVFLAEPQAANVHALRGAARRLRAGVWLFSVALPARDTDWVRRELKWLARQLGVLRDLDVLLERIATVQHGHYRGHTQPKDPLPGLATLARREAAVAALAALRSARATVLVDGFEAWLFEAAGDLDETAEAAGLVIPALRALDAEVHAHGRHIGRLRPRRRHALRGQVKTLRYATEAFVVLAGRPAGGAYLETLADLSHVLGALNDDAVGAALSEKMTPDAEPRPKTARRPRLKAAWTAFATAPRLWDALADSPACPGAARGAEPSRQGVIVQP